MFHFKTQHIQNQIDRLKRKKVDGYIKLTKGEMSDEEFQALTTDIEKQIMLCNDKMQIQHEKTLSAEVCHSRKNRHQKALKNGMNRRNSFDFSPPGRIYSTVHLTTSLCRHDILAKERNIPKGSSPWHKPIMSAPHCQATFAA